MTEGEHLGSELGVGAVADEEEFSEEACQRVGQAEEHGEDHSKRDAQTLAGGTRTPGERGPGRLPGERLTPINRVDREGLPHTSTSAARSLSCQPRSRCL